MIRSVIIDDEQNCIESLAFDLRKYCPEVEIVATCTSPKQGLLAIGHHKPDLVFLDVQMPWMNGFEMLEVLQEINFAIIFTTAFDQFAARAFRLSAIDYLLKPVDTNDLKESIRKVSEKIAQKTGAANIDNLLHNINKPEAKQRIAFAGREGYEFVEIGSIVYARAEGAYTHVYLNNKRKLVISKTLSDIEEMLPPEHFQRIHHSTLVNLDHVTHFYKTDGGYLILDTGD
ncbi:MAG TPA: LytTR family DNA-binding domain-containing protein, partial [Chitinophagaceae bacterium]|nr:LytTR family DNA-binding domain-containing protein [Chitinophagaceae bacterium]